MALETNKNISSGSLSGVYNGIVIPAAGVQKYIIRTFSFCNTHTGQVVVSIGVENENNDWRIVNNMTLDPGDTLVLLDEGEVLVVEQAYLVKGSCDVEGVVDYNAFGDIETVD